MADFAETISDEAVGRRLARAIHGKGPSVSADELRAMLDRFPESDRGRTIAHARTERSARPKLGGWNGVVRGRRRRRRLDPVEPDSAERCRRCLADNLCPRSHHHSICAGPPTGSGVRATLAGQKSSLPGRWQASGQLGTVRGWMAQAPIRRLRPWQGRIVPDTRPVSVRGAVAAGPDGWP
jgi:hypothetical protein